MRRRSFMKGLPLLSVSAIDKTRIAGADVENVSGIGTNLETAAEQVLSPKNADRLRWHERKDRTWADAMRVPILDSLEALHAGQR